jgi:hypothetical protein
VTILEALNTPELLGSSLIGDPASWDAWRGFLAAFFGLPLLESQLALYRECTARETPPATPFQTAYLICGRGAGKSFVLALVATYLACFRDWSTKLAPGGKPIVMLIAPTREQAKIDLSYIVGILEASPVLRRLVTNVTANSVELSTGVVVETGVPNYRSIRGRSICVALFDEVAFLRTDESVNPDTEIVNAVSPSLGRFGLDGVLLFGSTPYAKRGVLYDGWSEYHGNDTGEALCWVSPTRTMNPTFSQELIDRELKKDRASAGAEYLAEWRDDLEGFISREAIEACVAPGIRERAPVANTHYYGFIDPAGGGKDAFTVAVGHREGDTIVLDAVRDRHGAAESIVAEYSALLKSYGVLSAIGDHYAKVWPVEAFARHGIRYTQSAPVRSEIYLAMLPLINSRRVELLDNPAMVLQFMGLVRKTHPSGKDSVEHPPNAHDDICNAVSGVCVLAATEPVPLNFHAPSGGGGRASMVTIDPGTQLPANVAQEVYGVGAGVQPGTSCPEASAGGVLGGQFAWTHTQQWAPVKPAPVVLPAIPAADVVIPPVVEVRSTFGLQGVRQGDVVTMRGDGESEYHFKTRVGLTA